MHPSLTIDRILTTHEAAHWLSIIKPPQRWRSALSTERRRFAAIQSATPASSTGHSPPDNNPVPPDFVDLMGVSGVMESRGGGMRWLVGGFGIVALLVEGCASGSFGTVVGTFQAEAGPISPPGQAAVGPWPLSGVVRFKDASGHTVDVTVGASGKFSVRLAPGTYSVVGVTSEFGAVDPHSGMSQPPCEMQNMDSTRVRAGQTDRITLICFGP